MAKFKRIIILFLLLSPSFLKAQSSIEGEWEGSLSIGLYFNVTFKNEAGSLAATMNIPSQNAANLPLQNVSFNDRVVHFELTSPLGLATFHGTLEGDSIKGKFTQGTVNSDFYLTRGIPEPPPPPVPYKQEEVEFYNGGIKLTGTLTLPEHAGNHPAVVLITGSGAQTRDEEIVGFKIFKVIAEHLTDKGIAVLRYDDRGTGGSGGNTADATSEDFAHDVVAAVNYLQSRNDIRKDAIGLLGHSEGGIVAPIAYTLKNDIAFLVLMAGTGVTGEAIIYEQSALIMKAENMPAESIKKNEELTRKIFTAIKEGKNLESFKEEMYEYAYTEYENATEEEKKLIGDKEKFAQLSYEQQMAQFNTAWFKYFITYNPIPALEKVKAPVLVLFGEKDLQVPPHQNRKPMEDALIKGGNKDYRVVVIPGANHLFQEAVTGGVSEYGTLKKEFAPGFLDTVSGWILERVPLSR